ncbi:glutathione S-transferase family protein [Undibacterium fentianense]|uniref:Glutathione S-transferase N-terminal domain-containing protein n=1 Tax=Undibacterium fentianense TaxID=2828728 RepID=A0A941E7G3_9BURK|nr:glutathione S-transferase N-terminal domain-containing protein [Undibacterium fentianense]MBR7800093.1 glutathione S-transferase N-terminal domain-containing protein [Undibacterium fentianense]
MLKILGKTSSINVRKVLWTCALLEFPFELQEYGAGTAGSVNSPEFLAMNPHGMVPVLIDQGRILIESNSICRYLASQAGRSDLLPQVPFARAQVERWMDWQISDLNNAWRYAFMGLVRQSSDHQDLYLIRQSRDQWNQSMTLLEKHMEVSGQEYLIGATFSLADVVIGLSVHRWRSTPMEKPDLPALECYFARLANQAGFAEFVANGYP